MCADICLREDVVAFISAEFTLRRDTDNPLELEIGVLLRIHGLDVQKSTVDSTQKMVADMLTLSIRIQPLPILPKMGKRPLHAPPDRGIRRNDYWTRAVFDPGFCELSA